MEGIAAGALPLEQWYFQIPLITRIYGTAVVGLTLACVSNRSICKESSLKSIDLCLHM